MGRPQAWEDWGWQTEECAGVECGGAGKSRMGRCAVERIEDEWPGPDGLAWMILASAEGSVATWGNAGAVAGPLGAMLEVIFGRSWPYCVILEAIL